MPRITGYETQVGLGAGPTGARVDPRMFGTDAAMMGEAFAAVTGFVEARAKARNQADLLRAKAAASRSMTNLELEFEQDTDWRTMEQRFGTKTQELHKQLSEGIADPATRDAFSLAFDELSASKSVSVRRRSWDLESNQSRADLDQVLADNARAAAAKPTESARYLKEGLDDIARMQAAGYITAEDAGKRGRKFLADHDEAKVLGLINTDPAQAERHLSDPKAFANLDPERRQRLYSQASTRADALESRRLRELERAERMAEKGARQRAEQLAKDGWDAMLSGKLSEDWLAKHKGDLDGSDYRALSKSLHDANDRPDNAVVYGNLVRRLYVEGADVRSEALAAYERHDIRPSTLKTLLDENQTAQGKSGPKTPYERGKSYIADAMKFSDLNPLPGQPQAMANALADFDAWATKNQGAGPEQALAYARDTVRGYSLINWESMSTSMRTPLHFKGSRAEPDLDGTKKALYAAFKAGTITEDRLADELQIVRGWEEAIRIRAQSTSQGDAKGKQK